MAEKEERILVLNATEDDFIYKHFNGKGFIPRADAVERMAKAICKFEMMTVGHVCKDCSEECFDHLELEVVDKAEAALDALLEETK